jgi:hypothetical protein
MRKIFSKALLPVLAVCAAFSASSCGQKQVKVTPPKPSPEEVAYKKELNQLRKQLREDYEKFLTEAYKIQAQYR